MIDTPLVSKQLRKECHRSVAVADRDLETTAHWIWLAVGCDALLSQDTLPGCSRVVEPAAMLIEAQK